MQEELYRRFSPRMYAVCLRYAGNAEEAEDILQDGFIKIFNKLGSFRSEGSFEGWIRRIIVHTCINFLKKYKKFFCDPSRHTIRCGLRPLG